MSALPGQLKLPQDKEQTQLLAGSHSVEEPPSNPRTIIMNLEEISSGGLIPTLSRDHEMHQELQEGV